MESPQLTALDGASDRERLPVPRQSVLELLTTEGFRSHCRLPLSSSSPVKSAILTIKETKRPVTSASPRLDVLLFKPLTETDESIIDRLETLGWKVSKHTHPFETHIFDGVVLILLDLRTPFLSNIEEDHWASLQRLFNSQNKILWVTEGSQRDVTKPESAQIHGLMRTIRDEDPSINFTTLDVQSIRSNYTALAIHAILKHIRDSTFEKTGDYEFVERDGNFFISRVMPDNAMNKFAQAERDGTELATESFCGRNSHIRLFCERVGDLNSLIYNEISRTETQLQENEIEIEVAAAGLNFKDIAISSGLIPGNERVLGFEGAGIVKRSEAEQYTAGQRVIFTKAGAFANRIFAETELVHSIPDLVSFEEAATLGAVYTVAMYSLFDLAATQKGQRVLIHSAAGGLGIACIQLCKYIGAEVYATVGNDNKRDLLVNTFGIQSSHIFSSRKTTFAAELMNATSGEGVDVIINSLTGDLLEESWGCIRDGGTMVELGKKDIIDRNYLPMEPFSRNVSYRSFDISHKSVPNSTRSR